MICEIICVAGFLCMSHLDIVHISSVYVHIICILSEHMRIMHILSALVLHMFFPNRQRQCDLYVISTTLYRSYDVQLSFHTMFTQTHIVNAIYMLYAHIHCCYIGQIDIFSRIELFPSNVLSSEKTNCKNDIQ